MVEVYVAGRDLSKIATWEWSGGRLTKWISVNPHLLPDWRREGLMYKRISRTIASKQLDYPCLV